MIRIVRNNFKIIINTFKNFGSNNPIGMAATTAFFAIFSIAPILIIIISVFGIFTNDAVIREKLFNELSNLVGSDSSRLLQSAIDNYNISEKSGMGALIGGIFFLISATTLFSIMQNSINYIWRIRVKSKLKLNVLKFLRDRLFSFGLILSLGLVLLISLVIDASMSLFQDWLSSRYDPEFITLFRLFKTVFSILITVGVFALIFRFLPDVLVKWKACWFAATLASVLFFTGKILISIFIGKSQLGVIYGAASSFVVVLLWIYYVSFIFYFGVQLSYQYSLFYDHDNKPLKFAETFKISSVDKNKL
ncbi:YihY/virulence factor BrkB family protein [Draconibacterium halophilum]|uniref:YihY/virulence factor BrkB family protein n=1 Tax=Draconibacterium halophilum TaxID=2706887 RepID=A0A6C0RH38_9BACT|nr:YihY/virulence factor BrkB family protein [Draconibacterium halophilum]QIA09316.1 YihY/virulence factor BrkB family protein [Draconibacterium halophilum]